MLKRVEFFKEHDVDYLFKLIVENKFRLTETYINNLPKLKNK